MNRFRKFCASFLSICIGLAPLQSIAEDIDIFTGLSAGSAGNPNILIVLDNTSNWARLSQKWPGGVQQGQSEVNAIRSLVNDANVINESTNLGLLEFVVNGTANDNGGYIRFPIQPMTGDAGTSGTAKYDFITTLQTTYDNITSPDEKRNSNTPYGNLMYDVYNYFTGSNNVWAKPDLPAPHVNDGGYDTLYSKFKSPLTANDSCARTFMIFIGNPNSSGPASDDASNLSTLGSLGGNTSNIPVPLYTTAAGAPTLTNLGYTSACVTPATCTTADYASCGDGSYDSCSCDTAQSTNLTLCGAGTQRYMITKTTTTVPQTNLGSTADCHASCTTTDFAACSDGTYPGGCSCSASSPSCPGSTSTYAVSKTVSTPAGSSTLGATSSCTNGPPGSVTDYSTTCSQAGHSCAIGTAATPNTASSCPAGTQRYMVRDVLIGGSTSTVTTTACYNNIGSADSEVSSACTSGGGTCGAGSTTANTAACAAGTQRYMVTDTTSTSLTLLTTSCYASDPGVSQEFSSNCSGGGVSCSGGTAETTTNACAAGTQRYRVYDQSTAAAATSLGKTSACYTSAPGSVPSEFSTLCGAPGASCAVGSGSGTGTATTSCPAGTQRYWIKGTSAGGKSGYTFACWSSSAAAAADVGMNGTHGYKVSGSPIIDTSITPSTGPLTCPAAADLQTTATVPQPFTVNRSFTATTVNKGYTLACYASAPTATATTTAGYTCSGNATSGGVCLINSGSTNSAALTCPTPYNAYSYGKTVTSTSNKGYTVACYASAPTANATTTAGYACTGNGGNCQINSGNVSSSTLACPTSAGYNAYQYTRTSGGATYTDMGYTLACTASAASASTAGYTCPSNGGCQINSANSSTGTLACPVSYTAYNVVDTVSTVSTTSLTSQTPSCYASSTAVLADPTYATPCTGTGVSCTATPYATNACASGKQSFTVSGIGAPVSTTTDLGYASACVASAGAATTADFSTQCSGSGVSCAVDGTRSTTTSSSTCSGSSLRYMVVGAENGPQTVTPTGTYSSATNAWYADEWARFMHQNDVNPQATGIQSVTTYTIDVFNAQQNAQQTQLLLSMAQQGGGRYFAARNEAEILSALKQIVAEIQSVNTTFAAASIPLSTSNRSQNVNKVFIGMFRADANAAPRWFGNLKQYTIKAGGQDLVDIYGTTAINSQTGFIADCATSYQTTDSGSWWDKLYQAVTPTPKSQCQSMPGANTSVWSDLPDGSAVEKGAVAEVLRKGNNPSVTNASPTWEVNRTIYTLDSAGTALATFNTANTGLSSNLVKFTQGEDINVVASHTSEQDYSSIITPAPTRPTRPSIHGDVVHSRPLAVDYGGASGVTVYYGANDGSYRAVSANDGKERWAFIAPEFNSRLSRLMSNSPLIAYPSLDPTTTPTPTPKDYFFDGSTGLRQNADNTKVWLYPTQRRGGRMVYSLDVTSPDTPVFKWRQGCPTNQTTAGQDGGCTTGFTGMGQTWSTPVIAKVKGYDTEKPVLIMGGGYDTCEDANTDSPSCSSPKGAKVYIMDADTGTLLKSFSTTRSVVADVSMIDVNNDGYQDYAYVVDMGGNFYRISFVDTPSALTPLAATDWTMKKVAYANEGGRKFMQTPALALGAGRSVYIALGSGDREHPLYTDYPYANVTNAAYVYLDQPDAYNAATTACDLDDEDAGEPGSCVVDYSSATTCNTDPLIPGAAFKAWRMHLEKQGEQTVTPALIFSGQVTFNTNRPIPPSQAACNVALGEGGGYLLDLLNASGAIGVEGTCNGSRRGTFVKGVGMPTAPVLVNIAGEAPIVIGAVNKMTGSDAALVAPQQPPLPIAKTRHRKYRYQQIDQ